jgi:hypothetical protein
MYHTYGGCSRTSRSVVVLSHLFLLGQIGIHILAQMPIGYQLLQVRLEPVTIFGEMAPFTMIGTHGSLIPSRRVTWHFWWPSKERFRFNLLKNPIDRLLEHYAVCFEGWSNEITWDRSNSGNLIRLSRWFNVPNRSFSLNCIVVAFVFLQPESIGKPSLNVRTATSSPQPYISL